MATIKSKRPKNGQWVRYNAQPGALRRRQVARDAARLAGQQPAYHADLCPGTQTGEWIGGRINGAEIRIDLGVAAHSPTGRRCRSDQRCAWIDGAIVTHAAGLTWLHNYLRGQWPHVPSRRQIATM